MSSSVPSGRRPESWHRYRRAQCVGVAQTQTPGVKELVRRPQLAPRDVYYRDSILLHSSHLFRLFTCCHNNLDRRPTRQIFHDVEFLTIAVSGNNDTMGQRCKGGAVQSDGCAWTSLKEGAHARS